MISYQNVGNNSSLLTDFDGTMINELYKAQRRTDEKKKRGIRGEDEAGQRSLLTSER